MGNEEAENGDFGQFSTFVCFYGWQVRFSEISCTSTMLLVLCSSVVQDVTTWSQMFLPCIDSLQDQLVTVRVGMAACQPPDRYIDRQIDRDGITHAFSEATVGQTKDSRQVGFVLVGR